MIQETLLTGRMAPWHADSRYGHFLDEETALTLDETRTLLQWIEEGSRSGAGKDPLVEIKLPTGGWPFGKPDFILRTPETQKIPPTGVLDYRHINPAPGTA